MDWIRAQSEQTSQEFYNIKIKPFHDFLCRNPSRLANINARKDFRNFTFELLSLLAPLNISVLLFDSFLDEQSVAGGIGIITSSKCSISANVRVTRSNATWFSILFLHGICEFDTYWIPCAEDADMVGKVQPRVQLELLVLIDFTRENVARAFDPMRQCIAVTTFVWVPVIFACRTVDRICAFIWLLSAVRSVDLSFCGND